MSARPLDGVRILDFTRVLAGPYATMILADLGAEVVKVEQPGVGDPTRLHEPLEGGESHYFLAVNRNKKSVAIDLRSDAGREVAADLVANSDVVIENFRPGVMRRLGLDYDTVRQRNPRIVYCSISGFGGSGPDAGRAAYNEVLQALCGLMSLNGAPDGDPTKLGVPVSDLVGGLFGVIGILAALRRRDETGRGDWIDTSLFDSSLSLLTYHAGLYFMTGRSPTRVGSAHHSVAPVGVYPTADGHVAVSVFTDAFWTFFCAAIERTDLMSDRRFVDAARRSANRAQLDEEIRGVLSQRPTAQWLRRFEEGDVPHAEIQSVEQALEHPTTTARGMVRTVEHPTLGPIRVIGPVLKFAGDGGDAGILPPPLLGEHSRQVLQDIAGYDPVAVDQLVMAGAIDVRELVKADRRDGTP